MKLLPSLRLPTLPGPWPIFGEKPGPSDIDLLDTARKTGKIMAGVEALSRKYVLRNIARYEGLAARARSVSGVSVFGENVDRKRLAELSRAVADLRDFFLALEKKRPGVRRSLGKRLAALKEMEEALARARQKEERFKQSLARSLEHAKTRLSGPERAIRCEAVTLRIALCEKRIGMIAGFAQKHAAARPALEKAGETIERFAFAVAENARLYDEAARTLAMRRDILDAFGARDRDARSSFFAIGREAEEEFRRFRDVETLLLEAARESGDS